MIYAGIGSRAINDQQSKKIEEIAEKLALAGYTLRSGGAGGADSAFENGCLNAGGKQSLAAASPGFDSLAESFL